MDNGRKRPSPPIPPKPRATEAVRPSEAARESGRISKVAPSRETTPTQVMDPQWTWAEKAGKPDESRPGTLTPEATARLKLLQRAASNFAARLPSVEQWATFLRAEIVPVYNAVKPEARMCLECAKRMPNKKPSTHVCSPECASSFATRTRRPGSRAGAVTVQPHDPGETAKISVRELAPASAPAKKK